jgi:cyclophilin family peptidyl-prolyl cis-trans isomerase
MRLPVEPAPPPTRLPRRQLLSTSVLYAGMLALVPPGAIRRPALAADEPMPMPLITNTASLSIAIGGEAPSVLRVGLFGDAAPKHVALFESLCAGTMRDLTYSGSSISRIERGKIILAGSLAGGSTRAVEREIDRTGYVRQKVVNRADDYLIVGESNALSHDRAGLISMRRGGGAFEFAITPAANPALDAERIVIGEVVGEGSAELIARLDALPTREPSTQSELSGLASLIALRVGLGVSVGGIIDYGLGLGAPVGIALGLAAAWAVGNDPRAQPDLAYRPLVKVRIIKARLGATTTSARATAGS